MKSTQNKLDGEVLALDVGSSRTGVARITTFARIAEALAPILESEKNILQQVGKLLDVHNPEAVVLGLPRSLTGQDTEQTLYVREVFRTLKEAYPDEKFFLVDEAGTTKEAELRVKEGESIDSVAAGIIAEDFLNEVSRGNINGVTL